MKALKSKADLVTGVALIALLLGFSFSSSVSFKHLIMKIIIMGLFALSLNIQSGWGGLRPLGHGLMFGLGAYTYAITTVRMDMNPYLAVLVTVVFTVLVSMFLGYLLVRKSDDLAFSFLSMGFCTLTYTIIHKTSYLGVDAGISGVPRLPFAISDDATYVLTVVVVCIAVLLIYLLSKSQFSWIFRAVRENKEKATCIGVNIVRVQLMGYVISGLFACIAGMLYTMKNNGAYTYSCSVQLSMEALIMCLLGGMNSFWGPALGAMIVTLFNTQVTNTTIYANFWLGILTLFVVMFMQGGILDEGLRDQIKAFLVKRRRKGTEKS